MSVNTPMSAADSSLFAVQSSPTSHFVQSSSLQQVTDARLPAAQSFSCARLITDTVSSTVRKKRTAAQSKRPVLVAQDGSQVCTSVKGNRKETNMILGSRICLSSVISHLMITQQSVRELTFGKVTQGSSTCLYY